MFPAGARTKLLAGGILLHFALLTAAALPESRFKSALAPIADWYPRWTGQYQDWSMYRRPDHFRNRYDLVARFADGHEEHPWGSAREMSPRRVYYIEALLLRNELAGEAQHFLGVLRERWPTEPRPTALVLRLTSEGVEDYQRVPERGLSRPGLPPREIERRW